MTPSEAQTICDYNALCLKDVGVAASLLRCVLGALSARPGAARVLAFGQRDGLSSVAQVLSSLLAQGGGHLAMVASLSEASALPAQSQDVVWSHHLMLSDQPRLESTLGEILRVLRPGGRAVFCEPEHVYIGRLPRARLLGLNADRVQLQAAPQEADLAEVSLGFGRALWGLVRGMFADVGLVPVSAASAGPFAEADARVLAKALPLLGLEPADEDRAVSAFYPKSPFYLLNKPDVMLVQSDWLVCGASLRQKL